MTRTWTEAECRTLASNASFLHIWAENCWTQHRTDTCVWYRAGSGWNQPAHGSLRRFLCRSGCRAVCSTEECASAKGSVRAPPGSTTQRSGSAHISVQTLQVGQNLHLVYYFYITSLNDQTFRNVFIFIFIFFLTQESFKTSQSGGPIQCRAKARMRTVFTDCQTKQLEALFELTDYPGMELRAELAQNTGLSEETVRVSVQWFRVYRII